MTKKTFLERLYTILLYTSLAFLACYLVQYDYIALPIERLNYYYLILSFLFLFAGFLVNAFCWYLVCKQSTQKVSLAVAILSHGLSIFGKYVPGKVWTIVGRATYLSRIGVPLTTTAHLSVYMLGLSIWVGLLLGIIGSLSIDLMPQYLSVLVFSWVLLSILLFIPIYRIQLIGNLMQRISPNNFAFPQLNFADHLRYLPSFFFFWLCWTIGFFFLLRSLFPTAPLELHTSLAFPFATTIGIVAIIFPGGLGVREGCLVFYLVKCGLVMENATLVSIVARMWFIVGEIFIFVTALLVKTSAFKEETK